MTSDIEDLAAAELASAIRTLIETSPGIRLDRLQEQVGATPVVVRAALRLLRQREQIWSAGFGASVDTQKRPVMDT
jgi:hypothetical protein